jgi:4-methyl-5(b-hydroxyethyl)-thiazole monophosphate biosynthesis
VNEPKKTLVPLADGCEETEAVTIVDVLRRGGIEVRTAALAGDGAVRGAHGIRIGADGVLPDGVEAAVAAAADLDAVVLPGGMGGTLALRGDPRILAILRALDARGAVVAAVCAAPMVLDAAGLLAGRRFCCYPGIEARLSGAGTYVSGIPAVVDGNLVTGTGPGTATRFAVEVLRALGGPADDVAAGMLL